MENKITDKDWFTEEGELVIMNGIALRDISKYENLVSYGTILAYGKQNK